MIFYNTHNPRWQFHAPPPKVRHCLYEKFMENTHLSLIVVIIKCVLQVYLNANELYAYANELPVFYVQICFHSFMVYWVGSIVNVANVNDILQYASL